MRQSPWWIVALDDNKQARINSISHFLSLIPCAEVPFRKPDLGKRNKKPNSYVPYQQARNVIPEVL